MVLIIVCSIFCIYTAARKHLFYVIQINQDQHRQSELFPASFAATNPDSQVLKTLQWSSSLQGTMKESWGDMTPAVEVLLLVLSCPLWSSWNFGICWKGGSWLTLASLCLWPLSGFWGCSCGLCISVRGISRAKTRREHQMVCVRELCVKPSQRHVSIFFSSKHLIAIYSRHVLQPTIWFSFTNAGFHSCDYTLWFTWKSKVETCCCGFSLDPHLCLMLAPFSLPAD